MQRNRELPIAKGFEGCDLLALHRDDAMQHDMQQEGCHTQEHHRNDHASHTDAVELVLDRPMGQLQVARDRAPAPIRHQQVVKLLDHPFDLRTRSQQQGDVVEAAFHVECSTERPAAHPEHPKAGVVGDHLAGANRIDVFRRQSHADYLEIAPPAVENRADRVPGPEPVGLREALGDDCLVRPSRIDIAALHQHDIVHDLSLALGNGHQAARGRLGKPFHIQCHVENDPRLSLCHARDCRDAVSKRQWRALQGREDVPEALALVIDVPRGLQ